jgi:hypothetical protein
LVRDNIIINMVDTGILISFHNYWTEPTLQDIHLIVIYKVCEILSIIIANIHEFGRGSPLHHSPNISIAYAVLFLKIFENFTQSEHCWKWR